MQTEGGHEVNTDPLAINGELVPAASQPLGIPTPPVTPTPLCHLPPHIADPCQITPPPANPKRTSCFPLPNGHPTSKWMPHSQMDASLQLEQQRRGLPTMYSHAGDFSHSLLNYECFPINGKFTATVKNMLYSNYPLVMAYSTVSHHLQPWNAPAPHCKPPCVS